MFGKTYGSVEKIEASGLGASYAGTIIVVGFPRKDGKVPVAYVFGSGRRIKKLMTVAAVEAEIKKITA